MPLARMGRDPRDPKDKIITLAKLRPALQAARRARRRVVFTNGVFDLLHPGHVTLLQKARSLGDLLVVGVNSDASVRRLKGPARPIIGEKDRAYMLASLEPVDFVVTFSEDTPLELIGGVLPDILVKGGDWKAGAIVGADLVRDRGGRVVRVALRAGFSTTKLKERIGPRRASKRQLPEA